MTKMLIIEDDEEMCEELRNILEEDYSIDTVHDGMGGMRFIGEENYDIILLDLKIPGIDGYEILKYIKTKCLAVKVLILTGSPLSKKILQEGKIVFHEDNYKDSILKLADGVINKPFDVEKVLFKIKELLG